MTTSMEQKEDASAALARSVVNARYENINPKTREVAKRSIFDLLGVMMAASGVGAAGCKEIASLVKEAGGKGESTVVGFGYKVPCWMAAFVNGSMAHTLDMEDVLDEAYNHPGIGTIPAALAMAERQGDVSGKEFITAVVSGEEIVCRLGLAVSRRPKGWKHDWMITTVFGVFSNAAAAGRLLGLNHEQMLNAFGIAFAHAAGTMELGSADNVMRGLYGGLPAWSGAISALMAQRGISGMKNSLEGKNGLFNIYFQGEYDRESLTKGLGETFELDRLSFKAWPSCRDTHAYIEATLSIIREHAVRPEQIKKITVFIGPETVKVDLCEPLPKRQKPQTVSDAKYSIPWTVACAAAAGKVIIKDFTEEGIKDPGRLALASKVAVSYDTALNDVHRVAPGRVEINTNEGGVFIKQVDFPYGSPENPMSSEELVRKFKDCLAYRVKPLSPKNMDKVVELLTHLEQVDNVSRVIELLK